MITYQKSCIPSLDETPWKSTIRRYFFHLPVNIGVFDSGIGGLTVLRSLQRHLPEYSYVYLGDNARAPYGSRSKETVIAYTTECIRYLLTQEDCALVIIACNTASADALRQIQQHMLPKEFPGKNVLGVLIPTAEEAAAHTRTRHVGVLATRSTVGSGAYPRELTKILPDLHITMQEAPLLVPLLEEGWQDKPETRRIVKAYLRPLQGKNIDTLILGCTHYPLLQPTIEQLVGKRVRVIGSGDATAHRLQSYLMRHPEYAEQLSRTGSIRFLTTDSADRFAQMARMIFGAPVGDVRQIALF